jgi:hypothetical protein
MPLVIALDTSVIEAEGFSFRGSKALQALVRAARAGHVKVLITDITDREVENRIRERVSGEIRDMAKAHVLAKTTVVDFKAMLNTLTSGAADDIVSQWREFLKLTGAEILSTSDMRAGPVLDAFFRRQPPFSDKKPFEFRDAFAIGRLHEWAKTSGQSVHVISKDRDFHATCDGRMLIHKSSIGDALALLFAGHALADSALAFLARSKDVLEELVGESLDSGSFEISEDWDADIDDYRIRRFDLLDSEVIEVLDRSVIVEARVELDLEVDATVNDYENSPRDSGEWVFLLKNNVRYTDTFDARLQLSITLEGDPRIPVGINEVTVVEPRTFVMDDDAPCEVLRSWGDDDDDD